MARVKVEERAYVYAEDHIPYVLDANTVKNSQLIELVPFRDLIGDNQT